MDTPCEFKIGGIVNDLASQTGHLEDKKEMEHFVLEKIYRDATNSGIQGTVMSHRDKIIKHAKMVSPITSIFLFVK